MPKEQHFTAPNQSLWCSNCGKIPFKESTPFEAWYSANVAPQVEQMLKQIPEAARGKIREASREQMAACWNAALETVCKFSFVREEFPPCGCERVKFGYVHPILFLKHK
jgi:hypothetical protein